MGIRTQFHQAQAVYQQHKALHGNKAKALLQALKSFLGFKVSTVDANKFIPPASASGSTASPNGEKPWDTMSVDTVQPGLHRSDSFDPDLGIQLLLSLTSQGLADDDIATSFRHYLVQSDLDESQINKMFDSLEEHHDAITDELGEKLQAAADSHLYGSLFEHTLGQIYQTHQGSVEGFSQAVRKLYSDSQEGRMNEAMAAYSADYMADKQLLLTEKTEAVVVQVMGELVESAKMNPMDPLTPLTQLYQLLEAKYQED